MDLAVIRLAPPADGPTRTAPGPEIVVDIVWAAAVPSDRLEHLRARVGPEPETIDVALFHLPDPSAHAAGTALRLCRRAIDTAPALSGWSATAIFALDP